jgi:alkylhydroperoxidase/carboxymuconolactone decarboxylase family protein YurZ
MSITACQESISTRPVVATLLPIVAVVFTAYLVIGIAMPVLPLHVHQGLGLGTFVAGLVAGSQFGASLISRFWAGHVADSRGAWANAMSAVPIAKDVFAARKIGTDQLPPASGPLLPLDEAAEAQRTARVGEQFGTVASGLVQYTTDVLFRDLWLRPGLAPRDRSLVTVSALIATGQVAQITYHLSRAMDNGLTQAQAGEVITHLAFYAGWPNAFSALPVAKDVFEKRPR